MKASTVLLNSSWTKLPLKLPRHPFFLLIAFYCSTLAGSDQRRFKPPTLGGNNKGDRWTLKPAPVMSQRGKKRAAHWESRMGNFQCITRRSKLLTEWLLYFMLRYPAFLKGFYTAALQKTHFNVIPRSLWDAITALFSHQFWYLNMGWSTSDFNNHSFISETQTMVRCAICLRNRSKIF